MGYYDIKKILNLLKKILIIILIIELLLICLKIYNVLGVDIVVDNVQNVDVTASIPQWVYDNNFKFAFVISYYKYNNRQPPNDKLYTFTFVVSPNNIILDGDSLKPTSGRFSASDAGSIWSASDIANRISTLSQGYANETERGIYTQLSLNNIKVLTNTDIYDKNGNLRFASNVAPPFNSPFFSTPTTELQNISFDKLRIEFCDYGYTDTLYCHILKVYQTISDNDQTIYYYSDKTFSLNNQSEYYKLFQNSTNGSYYAIPKYKLSLQTNSTYYFILSNNGEQISNSVGVFEKDINSGIFDVVSIDTTNIITDANVTNDNLRNIQDNVTQTESTLNDFQNNLMDENVSNNTNTDINNSLNKDVSTESDTLVTSFFTRITQIITNVADYNLSEDTEIIIPIPFTNNSITLHSNYLYTYLNYTIKTIIQGFWYYLFGFYIFKFVNKIIISIKSGNILNGISTSDEVITNDML